VIEIAGPFPASTARPSRAEEGPRLRPRIPAPRASSGFFRRWARRAYRRPVAKIGKSRACRPSSIRRKPRAAHRISRSSSPSRPCWYPAAVPSSASSAIPRAAPRPASPMWKLAFPPQLLPVGVRCRTTNSFTWARPTAARPPPFWMAQVKRPDRRSALLRLRRELSPVSGSKRAAWTRLSRDPKKFPEWNTGV